MAGAAAVLPHRDGGIDGTCEVSPKGDPPGFALVLDDTTIAIPDRPGNKRVDGMLNILRNAHVGMLFIVPGRRDTLRINGRARIVRDAAFFDDLVVRVDRPKLAIVVHIEEVSFHCAKAFRTVTPERAAPGAVRALRRRRPGARPGTSCRRRPGS